MSHLTSISLRADPQSNGLALELDEVDIWCVTLDDQPDDVVQLMPSLMSRDEAERARTFYFDRDRRRFIIARGVLRMLLGRYVGRRPEEIVFQYGPNGKP